MFKTTFIGKDGKEHTMITQDYKQLGYTYVIFDNKSETQGGVKMPEMKVHLKQRKEFGCIPDKSDEIPDKPKEIKSIWDNGGVSLDRYTVVLKSYYNKKSDPKAFDCLALSDNPTDPSLGFSQSSSCHIGTHLGKRIDFYDLPRNVIQHIIDRLKPDEWAKHRNPENNF